MQSGRADHETEGQYLAERIVIASISAAEILTAENKKAKKKV